jgi:hypothetical protein
MSRPLTVTPKQKPKDGRPWAFIIDFAILSREKTRGLLQQLIEQQLPLPIFHCRGRTLMRQGIDLC